MYRFEPYSARLAALVLGLLVMAGPLTAQPGDQPAAPPQTATASGNPAQIAVGLIGKLFTINDGVNVPETRKPLPKDGSWGVRAALAAELVAACASDGVVCREVIYRSGQPEVTCQWTVLFPPSGAPPKVVSVNESTTMYMLRQFGAGDTDVPKLIDGSQPQYPPIARVTHTAGKVVLRAVVDGQGKVQDLSVFNSTSQMFNEAALRGVKNWKMQPYVLNGTPLAYVVFLPVTFGYQTFP